MFNQDDPKKCTAAKLLKFNLARQVKRPSPNSLILDPFSEQFLLPADRRKIHSVTAIDCSWNHAGDLFSEKFRGISRKLPPLLAGNPVNYSKIGKLTTVEAVSAALYVLGEKSRGLELLNKFKWGHTFYDLNKNLLEEYSKMTSESQLIQIVKDYGLVR